MRHRRLGGLLIAGVVCSGGLVVGCGGPEPGTHVQVDKEKEDAVLKGMESFYEKQAPGKKAAKPSPGS